VNKLGPHRVGGRGGVGVVNVGIAAIEPIVLVEQVVDEPLMRVAIKYLPMDVKRSYASPDDL